MIYLTADTHFYHKNVIKFCGRPYADTEEMNEALVFNWNAVVFPHDTVFHLGDVIFGGSDRISRILPRLQGRKYLIPGNHDNVKALKPYFEEILPPIYVLKSENSRAVLCHFPLLSWENKHYGYYHFHGHTHGAITKYEPAEGDYHGGFHRILDVGVDAVGYKPIKLEEAMNLANGRNIHPNHQQHRSTDQVE